MKVEKKFNFFFRTFKKNIWKSEIATCWGIQSEIRIEEKVFEIVSGLPELSPLISVDWNFEKNCHESIFWPRTSELDLKVEGHEALHFPELDEVRLAGSDKIIFQSLKKKR